MTEVLFKEYRSFQERDLSFLEVEYLFLDAVYESVRRLAQIKEAILVAWGITREGRKVLISFSLGEQGELLRLAGVPERHGEEGAQDPFERYHGWSPRVTQSNSGGIPQDHQDQVLGAQDGKPLLQSSPSLWPELKAEIIQIRDAANYESGKRLAQEFTERHRKEYPSLVSCLLEDLEALLSHLKFPPSHRKCLRSTNLIERSFVEERRRTKAIPGFWTEMGCLKLVFSVLIRASSRWRKIPMGEKELQKIDALRRELELEPSPMKGKELICV